MLQSPPLAHKTPVMQAILQNISVLKKQESKQKQEQIPWISGNQSFPYKVVSIQVVSVQMEVDTIYTSRQFDSLKVVSIQSNNLPTFEDLVNIYKSQIIRRSLSWSTNIISNSPKTLRFNMRFTIITVVWSFGWSADRLTP